MEQHWGVRDRRGIHVFQLPLLTGQQKTAMGQNYDQLCAYSFCLHVYSTWAVLLICLSLFKLSFVIKLRFTFVSVRLSLRMLWQVEVWVKVWKGGNWFDYWIHTAVCYFAFVISLVACRYCVLVTQHVSVHGAHTHLHTATRIPTGPVMYPDADHFVQGLYIESMTAPITPNFCRNRLLHIKRCVKKIVIAYVFETCLLQDFEKKELYIFCA